MSILPSPESPAASALSTVDQAVRLKFLDGLRALAALWVLWGHCHLFAYGWDSHKAILMWPLNLLLYLHLGVVVFLVLSGVCLGLPVVRNHDVLPTSSMAFFRARAYRILPPYYAVLILILLVNFFEPIAAWARHPIGLTATIPWQVWVSNFTLMHDFFPQFNTVNTPFWSIAVEWHLYFLFPLLVWILRRSGGVLFLIIGSAMAWGLTWLSSHLPEPFSNWQMSILRPYFLFLFVLGIFSAWFAFGDNHQTRMRKKWWILAPIGGASLLLFADLIRRYAIVDSQSVGPFFANEIPIDFTFAILVAVFIVWLSSSSPDHVVRRLLESRLLTKIGGFSYSLYLVHIPIVAATHHAIEGLHLPTNFQHLHFVLLISIGTSLSLGFAWAFSRLFETGLWWRLLNRRFIAKNSITPVHE